MDYLAFGFSDGVGSRSSLSLQNGDQPIERRTSRLWINKLTGRVDDEPASLPARPNRLTPTRSFPQVAVGLEAPSDGRRTTQSPPRRLSTVVSDPSAQSGQSLDADLRNRLAACEEALDAVQTRLATIEAQVHGVDDDELWFRATVIGVHRSEIGQWVDVEYDNGEREMQKDIKRVKALDDTPSDSESDDEDEPQPLQGGVLAAAARMHAFREESART